VITVASDGSTKPVNENEPGSCSASQALIMATCCRFGYSRMKSSKVSLRVVDDLLPGVLHDTTQYANNRIECDHGRLKARLRPMRGLRTDRTASTVIRGHAFIQNVRRGHYELGIEARHDRLRVAAAFDELAEAI
jgi:hypothetical protein